MKRLLVGDIGGTNTRLRLYEKTFQGIVICSEESYSSASYDHLNSIVTKFLADTDSSPPTVACFAIAGPVSNDHSQAEATNVPSWPILYAGQMEADLRIAKIRFINDFAAVGHGILALQPQDMVVLQDRPKVLKAPIAVLGAGTGLGEALLVWQKGYFLRKGGYEVLATEGGHTDFAARTELEVGLLQFLRERHGRVSVERVVSGEGIYRIYEYLRASGFAPTSADVEAELTQGDGPAVVSNHALAKSDHLCVQALDLFVAAYGAEAGNLALNCLPYGGLYLAGGVGGKILPKLQDGEFMENFLDKGRMRSLLENIPVSLIVNPKVGLLGAALYAQKLA
jgi:glucokinase